MRAACRTCTSVVVIRSVFHEFLSSIVGSIWATDFLSAADRQFVAGADARAARPCAAV